MKTRSFRGFTALLIGVFFFSLPAATLAPHEHPEDPGGSCALCHSLHLPGFPSIAPGISRPVSAGFVPVQDTAGYADETFSLHAGRGPPDDARIS
jgi:hypothetical protein